MGLKNTATKAESDLSPETFIGKIEAQKRHFIIFLGALLVVAVGLQSLLRWQSNLQLAAVFGVFIFTGALVAIPLAWKGKVALAAHLLLITGLLTTAFNQYAMRSVSLGPILNVFTIFIAAMYLLTPRWGVFYGVLALFRALGLKMAQDFGLVNTGAIQLPISDWYASLGISFLLFAYLLVAMVRNNAILSQSYRNAALTRQRFLARMSHEIRTPLNGLLGIGELLAAKIQDTESQNYINIILRSGQNLLSIANQALEISRMESRAIIAHEPYDPRTLVEQLGELFARDIKLKKLTFHLEINSSVPQVIDGDPGAVGQIITNLLHNAIKFTEIGEIRLQLITEFSANQYWAVYSVTDTGRGISENKAAAIFEAYNQGDNPTPSSGGVGLGLAICRELSLLMDGELTLRSKPGEGSVFSLRIPYNLEYVRPKESDPAPAEATHLSDLSRPINILSVDDESMNQMLIKVFLEHPKIVLNQVLSGQAALESCAQKKYDLILMDLNMPDMDGIEALHKIRSQESAANRPPVPIIAVTASVMPEEVASMLAAGFSMHLGKPLSQEDLFAAMEKIVSGNQPHISI